VAHLSVIGWCGRGAETANGPVEDPVAWYYGLLRVRLPLATWLRLTGIGEPQ